MFLLLFCTLKTLLYLNLLSLFVYTFVVSELLVVPDEPCIVAGDTSLKALIDKPKINKEPL